MTEKELGLYYPSGEFRSRDEIAIDNLRGNVSVQYPDRQIAELPFEELSDEMVRRAQLRMKAENKEYYSKIEIKSERPIGLVWWADVHAGGQQVDYGRLRWEADEIKRNPYLKVALGGDFSDSFIWASGCFQDIANLNEQNLFLYRLIEYIGYDKVLFGVIGNHPAWARKSGLDGYSELKKKIPIFDGIGTVEMWINDVPYYGAAIHKAKGTSYLDPNFGGKRFLRENDGYDFVLTAHTHFRNSTNKQT